MKYLNSSPHPLYFQNLENIKHTTVSPKLVSADNTTPYFLEGRKN